MICENKGILNSYLFSIFTVLRIVDPMRLFISIMIQSITGIECQSHYRESFSQVKQFYSDHFLIYCPDKILEYVSTITNSMASWKLFLFQAHLLKNQQYKLLHSPDGDVLEIDVTVVKSSSSKKEGTELGYNAKSKGRPCFQLSASLIGRIFVDAKLFPGHCNPKKLFSKSHQKGKVFRFAF